MIDPLLWWLACSALGAVFAASSAHKLADVGAFASSIAAYRIAPAAWAPALARAFVATEAVVATALLLAPVLVLTSLFGAWPGQAPARVLAVSPALTATAAAMAVRLGAVGALGLLGGYSAAVAVNLGRGRRDLDCGCYGPARRRPISALLLVRNAGLAAIAAAVLASPSARPLVWIDAVTLAAALATAALLWSSVGALAAISEARARVRRSSAARLEGVA